MHAPRFRSYPPRALAGGFVLMLLSSYLALVSGFLSVVIGDVIGEMVSTDSLQVTITGARTDLFWNTSVERVYVTDTHGLVVDVEGARVEGALHGLLISRHMERITVTDLRITIPRPRIGGERTTLPRILANIDRGIITGADSLILLDGSISDSAGAILDGMNLVASVSRGRGAHVTAARASTWIRGMGLVTGSGQVSLEDGDVTSQGFSASTRFGNLYFDGRLRGATSTVDIAVSGTATTTALDIPLAADLYFDGIITGTLGAPVIHTGLRNGFATLYGHEIVFSADTLVASLDSIALKSLSLSGEGLSISSDCRYRIADGAWDVSTQILLDRFDPSSLSADAPEASLSGSIVAYAAGTPGGLSHSTVTLDLDNSSFMGFPVANLEASASMEPGRWTLSAAAASPGLTATLSSTGASGLDLIPVSYSGRLGFTMEDASMVPLIVLPESMTVRGVQGDLAFAGNRRGLTMNGSATAETLCYPGGYSARGVGLEGEAAIGGQPRGVVRLVVDSLRTPLMTFSVGADLAFSDGVYSITGFEGTTAGGLQVEADAVYRDGDPAGLVLENLRLGSSKQRFIQDGGLVCLFDSTAISVDTAWVQTPHGTLCLHGDIGGDSSNLELSGRHVDLSQLGGLLHLQGGVSGMGEFGLSMSSAGGVSRASLSGRITGPSFGAYQADSITMDIDLEETDLFIRKISSWDNGISSSFSALVEDVQSEEGYSISPGQVVSAELILNRLGDWVFYALPIPLRTRGADISARLEYLRDAPVGHRLTAEAVASIDRLFITSLNMYLSNVVMHLQPDTSEYGTRITLSSADSSRGTVMATLLLDINQDSLPALSLDGFVFRADFNSFRASVGGFANVLFSGYLKADGEDPAHFRPELTGKLEIQEGIVGMPQEIASGGSSEPVPLPVDLRISILGERGIWFRNSLADIEMNLNLMIITQQGLPTVSGTLTSARGKVHLLQKDFDITEGVIEFLPGIPPEQRLSITAVTVIRGAIDRESYTITVHIDGSPADPVITLSGEGPLGSLSQEDILALLAVGITYGELQQMDTGALQMQLGGAAQSYIGQLLARSLREGIGLDQLELTPELLSDSTSLTLNVGKYILPDLFVSFTGDVFSSEPGTISAQYYIQPDLYLVGSTKSTLHGDQEPSLELHYTLRY